MDASVTGAPRLNAAELLARLVSFDTTSRNSNLALIAYVRDYLGAHGIPYRISTDSAGEKANIRHYRPAWPGWDRAVRPCRYCPGRWPGLDAPIRSCCAGPAAGCMHAARPT
jgi:hypothetical protein